MNINPFGPTTPHYDSYDDFYKFFEVPPKDIKEGISLEVFPPIKPKPLHRKKQEKTIESEQNSKRHDILS